MCINDNICDLNCQSPLKDEYISSKTGEKKERPWREKKLANELLALAYDSVNESKAKRLRECATHLAFERFANGDLRLKGMNSCRVRLCPMCSWRRSLKNYHNNRSIVDFLEKNNNGAWLFLTLTVKNVTGDVLTSEIDHLMYAWKKLLKNVDVKRIVRGFYRGFEVTHDCDFYITRASYRKRKKHLDKLGLKVGDLNPTYDTYHPHFHALVYVNKSYFESRDYMSYKKWQQAWQQALGVDYEPQIDIKRVKVLPSDDGSYSLGQSVGEISKYSTKPTDYIYPDDWDLTIDSVRVLDEALANRQLITYGGEVKEAFKQLKLEDADKGDLVRVGESDEHAGEKPIGEAFFYWHVGYRQYFSK